jgi:hypothetical protein
MFCVTVTFSASVTIGFAIVGVALSMGGAFFFDIDNFPPFQTGRAAAHPGESRVLGPHFSSRL